MKGSILRPLTSRQPRQIPAELFPKSASGRANGALNLLHIGDAFAIQVGIGFIAGFWPVEAALSASVAYQTAFGINLALQVYAIVAIARNLQQSIP